MTKAALKRYEAIVRRAEKADLKHFESKPLRDRVRFVGGDEARFWTEFYHLTVRAYAETFGPKWLPETFKDTDRMLAGPGDWDAIVEAIRHIQMFLAQHDLDHDAAGL